MRYEARRIALDIAKLPELLKRPQSKLKIVPQAMIDYVKANDALVQQTATVMSVEATIAQRRSKKIIAYDSCDAASVIRTVLYFEFNSIAASRTKRWKNTGRYRVILIEPKAA